MKSSIIRKVRETAELGSRFIEVHAASFEQAAIALADRFRRGGRLFVMGNGGSACDAQHLAVEFQHPILEKRRPLPAVALSADAALLTAIANDGDFSQVYSTRLELESRPVDAAIGLSTSGASTNVNLALRRARQMGLLTIGLSGRDGGAMVDACEFCFVVPSWSIHRTQEVHAMLIHLLWDHVHIALGEDDVL
jgi:D-sedoheptulose 7-phosphate isomerase